MDEIMPDIPEVAPAKINIGKASTQELKNIPVVSDTSEAVTRELMKRGGKVKIKINSTERDKSAVFVGVNGRGFNIPRDTWVEVPVCVLGVLENAMIREYRVKADPKSSDQAEISSNDVARFGISTKPADVPVTPETVSGTPPRK